MSLAERFEAGEYELKRHWAAGDDVEDLQVIVDGIVLGYVVKSEGRENTQNPAFHRLGHTCFAYYPWDPELGMKGTSGNFPRMGGPERIQGAVRALLHDPKVQAYYEKKMAAVS